MPPRPQPQPHWWRAGSHDGRPLREILACRDVTRLFRFLKSRGLSRAAIAAGCGLSETRVRAIMLGRQQVTSYEVFERIADGFHIDRGLMGLAYADATPSSPVMVPRDDQPVADPSSGPDFLGSLAAFAVGSALTDLSWLLPPRPPTVGGVPAVVTASHVAMVREVADRHRRFDADRGGGCCRDSALAYLRWAHGMLDSRFAGEDTERALKAALSDLYQVVGWACHDLGDHGAARRYLTAGLAMAREIDDLSLVTGAFYRLGRVSIHQGRAREALRLWQLGQIVAQDSGCLVSVAVLHANEAWAYAMLGGAELVCDSLARAEGELARVDAASVPSWAQFFLAPADIDGIAGVVYACLAAHAEHRASSAPLAVERSTRAYQHRQPGETRSRTFDAISLASCLLLDGDLDAAERYTRHATNMIDEVDSARAVDRLREVGHLARRHAAAAHTSSRAAGILDRVAHTAAR